MQPKDCERALTRAIQALDSTRGASVVRALARLLDRRQPLFVGALLASEFTVADIDAYARSEGVSARRSEEGPGRVFVRIRDALNIPSWPRLNAMVSEWDRGGDPWMDVATAAQPALFDWWQHTADARAMVGLCAEQRQFEPSGARPLAAAIADLVLDARALITQSLSGYTEEAVETACAVLQGRVPLTDRERAVLERRILDVQPEYDWGPREPIDIAREVMRMALDAQGAEDAERAHAIVSAIDKVEAALLRSRVNAPYVLKPRPNAAAERAALLRKRCECPELARWVAACARRPR